MPTIVRAATAVEANLNKIGREMISEMNPRLSTHKGGPPRKSMHPDEMKKVD
jgi:hypothetical protein